MKKTIIWIFLGIPMCGKGVMGLILRDLIGAILWVMRDIISEEKKQNMSFADLADGHEKVGTLIPDDKILSLLKKFVDLRHSEIHVFDGAGRNLKQMKALIELIRSQGVQRDCIRVVHFQMTEEESMVRFEKKWNAPDRQGRKDADHNVHQNRIRLHLDEEPKLLSYLTDLGIPICQIDAISDNAPEKVVQIINGAGLEHPDKKKLAKVIITHLPGPEVLEFVNSFLRGKKMEMVQ